MSDNSPSDTNVKIDITANADGMAPGVAQAQGDLDKVAGATSEFEKKQRAAVETSEKMAHVTGRTREQFAQLGKEVVNGDTGRMPGTLASIAMSMLPVSLGLGAIAALAAAGVWAWKEWGGSAEEEAAKVAAALKKANDEADRSKHMTTQEQIQAKQWRIESLKGEIAWIDQLIAKYNEQARADPSRNREFADKIAEQARLRGALQRNIENETRNISDLQKPGSDKAAAHQEEIDRTIEREQSKYDRLHQMAVMADATDAERISFKLAFDLKAMEKEHNELVKANGGKSVLDQEYQNARLDRIAIANAEAEKLTKTKEEKEEAERQRKMRADASVANFSKLLRHGDFTDAMSMAERMTAGLATKSRAAFEINKAAALAGTAVKGYQAVMDAYESGAKWGGTYGGAIEAIIAAAFVATQLQAINSTKFGGGVASVPSGGGVPSQATSPGIPVTPTESNQSQAIQITIYNQGNLLSNDYVEGTIIPQIQDAVQNRDVLLIDPRSRQAAVLGA